MQTPSLGSANSASANEYIAGSSGFFSKFIPLILRNMRWLVAIALMFGSVITFLVLAQSSAPAIPPVNLSSVPLYSNTITDKPVLALALSVEFPTVGAQYVNVPNTTLDNSYSNANEYLGYYDAESCYSYNNRPTETPLTGFTATDYKRFDRSGPATNRMCADAFSGNFLNWSSSSAIDMLRLSLSGGDRLIDAPDLTILQRAVLTNGDTGSTGACFWNSNNFPAKQLLRDGGTAGTYWGAVPVAMRTQAGTNDIWVANNLNRIYFGTSRTGGCDNNAIVNKPTHVIGIPVSLGPVVVSTAALPSDVDGTSVTQGNTLAFSGLREVWYGSGTNWRVAPATTSVACTNAVLGTTTASSPRCYHRPYTGAWVPPANVFNTDGFFYSRVRVCESSSGVNQDVRDYGLCSQYPNGNYKPTGSIQKYSEQLRLAAFGYLLDQTRSPDGGRQGGVLRAPMKYVGARTYNIEGVENTGANPNAEWDAQTGVFVVNPDSDTTQTPQISGVINYLNRFGRTGPVPGRYKRFDPVGELHYEVLRYLQGLQPTPATVSGITTTMYDGFPAFSTWVDPYGDGRTNATDYSCYKSNIVTIGDINTHDGNTVPSANVAGNIPDINYWTGIARAFESNSVVSYVDGQGVTRTTGNPNTPNSSSANDRIIGAAYWARTHDIRGTGWTSGTGPAQQRPGLRVKSFFFDVNEYATSNVTATRRTTNKFFTAAKYGGFETFGVAGASFNTRGNPFRRQDGTVDNNVWQNPATPGEAAAYYLQSNARGVLRAFDDIFASAATQASSIAGAAVSNRNLSFNSDNLVYQGSFDASNWSGDLVSTPIDISTNNVVTVGSTPNWSAATRLAALAAPATSRNIVVGVPGATSNPTATPFTWAAISTTLKEQLSRSTPGSVTDTLGQARLNFIRGDRSREGGDFRIRGGLLGDIVNSGVLYSGTPTTNVGLSSSYPGFYTSNVSRTPTVFVGANDGMLHAFNARTGDEVFAFIPSPLGSKLAALTSRTYDNNHQNYVDSTGFVTEAQVGSAGTSADWKTVLASGMGGGARGVFALDVTSPSTFSSSNVMWEFTQSDDADMGFVVGRPQIVKMRTSAYGAAATYRWFAMVASGVNNYVPDANNVYSTTGNPALFLLALDKPVGTAWSSTGSTPNYYKISLPPISTTLSVTRATGLINFQVTYGSNLEVAQVYLGDLHGSLWKLDFSLNGASTWNLANLSPFVKSSGTPSGPYPLYIARDSTGAVQPISTAPSVVNGPIIAGLQTAYIAFGTGKFLEQTDKGNANRDSIHAIFDNGSTTADSSSTGRTSVITGRGRLIAGSVNTATGVISVPAFTWGRAASDGDTTQRSGWYADFPNSGERQVSNAIALNSLLTFSSLIPSGSGSGNQSCTASNGDGFTYVVNIESGAGQRNQSDVGLLGEPLLFNLVDQTTKTPIDSTGRAIRTIVSKSAPLGLLGLSSTGTTITSTLTIGRLSWRQINNYQDIKNSP